MTRYDHVFLAIFESRGFCFQCACWKKKRWPKNSKGKFCNYLDERSLWDFERISTDALECLEVFLVAYTYLFQFKFGNFCRNSVKQATALYVHSPLLKTLLRQYDESFKFWSKNHFCVKIWFIVIVVWRMLAELAKIQKIWHCQSHSHPLSKQLLIASDTGVENLILDNFFFLLLIFSTKSKISRIDPTKS
jgi:hypothetical protein